MSLTSGTRLGPYEILAPLGAGGMGEVYLGRDTQLKRDVALKVLPAAFTDDADRLARFQREAELLATLNHPHIAAIYGLERTGATTALVLELVEGETLADRIGRGPIPIDEAVPIARQIADALESAHDRGIIHRDLKPANVKVRPDGTVKVLDFGLAKALDEEGPGPHGSRAASLSPTMTSPAMTRLGIILGTAAYMSPEQARGRPVDRRSDVWAFGCVLYEMLTGHSVFGSDAVSDTLAAVLRAEPDWNALPAETPPRIRLLLQRCLRKDARQRLPHIGAARLDLDDAFVESAAVAERKDAPARPARWLWAAVAAATLTVATLAVPAVQHLREAPATVPVQMRPEISTPPTSDPYSFAMSPDGRQIVFSAEGDGRQQLWHRALGEVAARPLPGADGGRLPFWSPDSRSIGFFRGTGLYRLDLDGSQPRLLAPSPVSAGHGGSWNADNVILFVAGTGLPVRRVSANGGTVTTALEFGKDVNAHRFPHFLPDQRHYLILGRGTRSGVYLASLDSNEAEWLTEADGGAVFIAAAPFPNPTRALVDGWVLYVRGGALFAHRFNAAGRGLTGDPIALADRVDVAPGPSFAAALSVSATGVIAYRRGDVSTRRLTWFDAAGTVLDRLALIGTFNNPQILSDGRIVVEQFRDNNTDLWVFDGSRGRRLTTDLARDVLAVPFDRGRRLYFYSSRSARVGLFQMPVDGSSSTTETRVADFDRVTVPLDVSPDGKFLLYFIENPETGPDIGVRSLADGKHEILLESTATELWAQFSPDGSWLAFQSNESGQFEIYVKPFPSGALHQVAVGIHPRWAPRGDELYFVAPDGFLMAVPIGISGARVRIGTPRQLFRPGIFGGGGQIVGMRQQYDVDARGRFLVNVIESASAPPITLLLNADAVRRKP